MRFYVYAYFLILRHKIQASRSAVNLQNSFRRRSIAVAALGEAGVLVYRTVEHGTVTFRSDGERWWVEVRRVLACIPSSAIVTISARSSSELNACQNK
jgi:hypothetical protein